MVIIGITGTLGAGKGTVVDYLLKELGFKHFSMSGFIAGEVKRRGLAVNRDNLVAVGNELRAQHGPGYVAEQLYNLATLTGHNDNCVIESIRTIGEVNTLKSKGRFYLFAVDADPKLRYERIVLRDSAKDKVSFEQFLRDEQREMDSNDPNKQNLRACIKAADYKLINNRTIDDLGWEIDRALQKVFAGELEPLESESRNLAVAGDTVPGRSLLSRDIVVKHIRAGNIFIHPFDMQRLQTNLKTTSYDVRLGVNFFQEQSSRLSGRRVFNPFDPDDIRALWGEPQQATLASEWMDKNGRLRNIRPEDKIIVIGPGETILAHTDEFIGGRNCVTTEMRARSSMGRIGITVCKCAGWGDLGFCNRWTMEMTNHLKDTPVLLVAGMRVAQIPFYQVDPLKESYSGGGGQYQTTDDTDEMIRNWSPYQMLPKFSRENY